MEKSTEKKIKNKISKAKAGSIFFMKDFADAGNPGAVKTALHRAEKRGLIKRLARGIYAKPKESRLVGEVLPAVEEIAKAIAARDKARIIPTGAYALNALGLSTQIPLKIVYLTDGSPRIITIGKRSIKFKKTTPKMLAVKGEISMLVIQALKAIGKGKTTKEEENKIITFLKKEDRSRLRHDIALAPQWIAEIMVKAL
ncbi:MAG: DUF6088 family protein [bacterium]